MSYSPNSIRPLPLFHLNSFTTQALKTLNHSTNLPLCHSTTSQLYHLCRAIAGTTATLSFKNFTSLPFKSLYHSNFLSLYYSSYLSCSITRPLEPLYNSTTVAGAAINLKITRTVQFCFGNFGPWKNFGGGAPVSIGRKSWKSDFSLEVTFPVFSFSGCWHRTVEIRNNGKMRIWNRSGDFFETDLAIGPSPNC